MCLCIDCSIFYRPDLQTLHSSYSSKFLHTLSKVRTLSIIIITIVESIGVIRRHYQFKCEDYNDSFRDRQLDTQKHE